MKKERFYVIVTNNYNGASYYYKLTQDQINLMVEFQECGMLDIDYQITNNEMTWEEI